MEEILKKVDLSGKEQGAYTGSWVICEGKVLECVSPIDMKVIGKVRCADSNACEQIVKTAMNAFYEWRMVPAPKRGDIVRQIGNALRNCKHDLGALVSLETGKIRAEGEGEVQEMIDICDYAVGQSRMLYGLSMHSERSRHRMYEQWHPIGPVGVITSFNFPVAVWAWNAMIALIAGDTVIWKPSSKAPLCAIATMKLAGGVLKQNGLPDGILNLLIGSGDEVGQSLIKDNRIPLISATGSIPMGRHVGREVALRLGRTILELGGNNAIIVSKEADLDLAIRAILFGAVGTAGQRCTTTRRIIVHSGVYNELVKGLINAYKQIWIGNPLEEGTLMGPLIDLKAVDDMQAAIADIKALGGEILFGGEVLSGGLFDAGTYVRPCICKVGAEFSIINEEIFAPILYIIEYNTFEESILYNNAVPQGLSSAVFTEDLGEAEAFLSHMGSDCGIANVNIGTSGAEIGGAFGGEKETGGGREAGSDSWKAYMRRQTCTINWSKDLPLAQGIRFELE